MQVVGDVEPGMTVDARAFIEPPFVLARIDPHYDRILATVMQEIGDVVRTSAIAAKMAAEVTIVDPYFTVPEYPVKLQHKTPSRIGPIHGKGLPIPANTVRREETTYRMIAMRLHVFVGRLRKRQRHRPVVRQLHIRPGLVIKIHSDCGMIGIPRLRQNIPYAIIEIFFRVRGIPKVKLPSPIKIQPLPLCQDHARRQQHDYTRDDPGKEFTLHEWYYLIKETTRPREHRSLAQCSKKIAQLSS